MTDILSASKVPAAITIDGVSKRFRMYKERNQSLKAAVMRGRRANFDEYWALNDVSFAIPKGSTFALIGENGSGKSTMLKCIAKILTPDRGRIASVGSMAALLELGSGFHPELSGRENVYLNGSILGMTKATIDEKFDSIVEFAGIGEFIDQPVKNYSSGMYVRLGFSVAINIDPDILLVDEVLAVGDASFQDKCMEKFADFRHAGKTVVIVSHAMGSMRTLCDEAVWLRKGHLVDMGPADKIVDTYVDESYTKRDSVVVRSEASDGKAARTGSGEAVLTKVELLDEHGQQTTVPYSEAEVTIRMHFEANQVVEKPVFALSIDTLTGVHAWAQDSRDSADMPTQIDGVGYVDLKIENLHLLPGTFDLHASINDRWRFCLRFDVHTVRQRETGGIVALGGVWASSD